MRAERCDESIDGEEESKSMDGSVCYLQTSLSAITKATVDQNSLKDLLVIEKSNPRLMRISYSFHTRRPFRQSSKLDAS